MPVKTEIPVALRRRASTPPHLEPVRFGVPFGRGIVATIDHIEIADAEGARQPYQVAPLGHWPDGSVRWALVDTLVVSGGRTCETLTVRTLAPGVPREPAVAAAVVHDRDSALHIDSGTLSVAVTRCPFEFVATRQAPAPVARAMIDLEDEAGRHLEACADALTVEAAGPVRVTVHAAGAFRRRGTRDAFARFEARITCYCATGLLRLDLTVHNPRRARHPGGIWDLGDAGSILLRGLTVAVAVDGPGPSWLAWRATPEAAEQQAEDESVEIYQASSGGEQWDSRTHVDRHGHVPLPFRGCRIRCGTRTEAIQRASPILTRTTPSLRVSVAVPHFWQQFPKALCGDARTIRVGLFPVQADAPFELQGGERKTHTLFCLFEPADTAGRATDGLAWVHDPLVACIPPEYHAASDGFPAFVPAAADPHEAYLQLADTAIAGPDCFFDKREVIDEYGWRHFGDTYADHEDVYFTGPHPVVSHYNNQYDLVYGFLLHFARTSDPRWFELAADLARHVLDIDLYHTTQDKPAYNGGLFWHTDHYQDAGRATHRGYTADSPRAAAGRAYGGGPSNENNYTTGLLYFHYLTGDPTARDAVVSLADWVLAMDDGTRSLLGHLDPGPTGLASCTTTFSYHGPGRGGGNSVSALLDAYRLTGERRYLAYAEALVARCVHPADDPERHDLLDAERRWSYLVFLQALGKYLDTKCELGERDAMFAYGQASLIRYAVWMLEHETPFLERRGRLQYPTESWPAQDIRKSCVFDVAARYGPPALRARFLARAAFFFDAAVHGVRAFPHPALARPLAVLLANGVQRAACRTRPPVPVPPSDPAPEFGPPREFRSQKDRVKRLLKTPAGWLRLGGAVVHPSVWWRVATGRIW